MKEICIFVIAAILLTTLSTCAGSRKQQLEHAGNRLVAEVETFRKNNGRLPTSLSEIGHKDTEKGPLYYRKENESRYVIWFGTQLGESVTYDSQTQRWEP